MRSEVFTGFAILALMGGAGLLAQETPLPQGSVTINLTKDSPVSLVNMTSDQPTATARGSAIFLNVRMAFTLRNDSNKQIHGIMLRVVAQEAAQGGKASVTMPSLNIGPNEVFPVRIDMQLVRPAQA